MDWTYFASKRFHVAEFQREASSTPVVVPMNILAITAIRAKRGTESRGAKILSHVNQGESMFAASRAAAFPHALLKIVGQTGFNPPGSKLLS